jgi:hypothetical protein
MTKYLDLSRTPTVSATMNNFKFQLFVNNMDDMDLEQPCINIERFIGIIKEDAGDVFG